MEKKAFSLIELSIVLVILGLLVGGVLAGQSLIRAAELRSISADSTKYKMAIMAFRDKYFALPGDMINATSFWGDQATGVGSCASASTADGTPGTCNGNGDGRLAYATHGEPGRLWQHMAMAGLIEGSYSGIGILDQPGVNIPASKLSGGGYVIAWMTTGGFYAASASDPNRIQIGRAVTGVTGAGHALLRPEEGWNIDTKMDDGNPYSGAMRGWTGTGFTGGGCVTGNAYMLTNNSIDCLLTLVL